MTFRKKIALLLDNKDNKSPAARLINLLLIGLIILNVTAIILESVNSIYQQYHQALWYFEVFSVIIFTIEYLTRIWSCIDSPDNKDSSPIKGRLKQMMTPIAIIDLLAILPFYLTLYATIDLRFLRVLRMLRLFKLTRYSPAMGALIDVIQKESEALLAAFIVLIMMLIFSSCGIYLLEHKLQPEVFGSIPDSMWWAIVTLTTVGYGDVVPMTTAGKLFGGSISLIGIGMVALPAAIMASGFAENLNERRQKYNTYIKHALSDGHIDDKERWKLEELRKELGLEPDEAIHLFDDIVRSSSGPLSCPHCGEKIDRRHIKQKES